MPTKKLPTVACVKCGSDLPDRRGGRKYCKKCLSEIASNKKKYYTAHKDRGSLLPRDTGDWLDYTSY